VAVYRALGFAAVPGKREGVRLWDLEGNSYINCHASAGGFSLGHRPPGVVDALQHALDELDIGDYVLMSEHRAALARRLAQLTPGDIQYTFFTPSGGEAVDLSIKLARGYTGRPGIVSAEKGYHGHTGFALSAGDPHFNRFFEPLMPGFSKVPFGDVGALEKAVSRETAAVILETIPATGGVLIPPDDYFPAVRGICDRAGAVLIVDEVQVGLGRTGRMWAVDEWDVVPDILVLGKAVSGGVYPISMACYRPHLDVFFQEHPFVHLSAFGGAELGCVAAMSMLDQVTMPGFLAHVREMGTLLKEGLLRLRADYPQLVVDVRGRGLMIGLEMVDDRLGPMMSAALAHHGVLALFADLCPSTVEIKPPLIIQSDEVHQVLEATELALGTIDRQYLRGEGPSADLQLRI
jgi:acetylornithine/succinyldiaminopimelate/putrescine aminotransferase